MNYKGKDVNSDWLAGQWDERSVLGHGEGRINKRRMKGDDPEIDTAQTQKRFNRNLTLQEKIRKTFADSIPNKYRVTQKKVTRRNLQFIDNRNIDPHLHLNGSRLHLNYQGTCCLANDLLRALGYY